MLIDSPSLGYTAPKTILSSNPLAAAIIRAASLPSPSFTHELNIRPRNIVNQRDIPCCVSAALGAAMETLHPDWSNLAPLFHYYIARFRTGSADADGFLDLAKSFLTLSTFGICSHDLHPVEYTESGMRTPPTSDAFSDGQRRALRNFVYPCNEVSKSSWMKKQLAMNYPVIIGFSLPAGYRESFSKRDFAWMDLDKQPSSRGKHCVFVFGYDETRQAFHIQDCQGIESFNRGCWWLGYSVSDNVVIEAHSIRR